MPKNHQSFIFLIGQVDRGIKNKVNARLKSADTINYSQFLVLASIFALDHPSPANVAAFLNQSNPSVLPHVAHLAEHGFIERHQTYSVGREHVLLMTELGERKLKWTGQEINAELAPLFKDVKLESQYFDLLEQLNRKLTRYPFPHHLL